MVYEQIAAVDLGSNSFRIQVCQIIDGQLKVIDSMKMMVRFAAGVDGILAYAYLGDVTASVTGDKKAQKFEDDYLDELFQIIYQAGIRAVTYMPTRNTQAQIERLRKLCEHYGMLQISGEDINSPRQQFVIEKMREAQFSNLIDNTWRLIRHEIGK